MASTIQIVGKAEQWDRAFRALPAPKQDVGDKLFDLMGVARRDELRNEVGPWGADVHAYCPFRPVEAFRMVAVFLRPGLDYCHAWIEDRCCPIDLGASDGVTAVHPEH